MSGTSSRLLAQGKAVGTRETTARGARRVALACCRTRGVACPAMSDMPDSESEVLIVPREAARLAGVDPKTLTRWEEAGRLSSVRTLGGHRRYRRADIIAIATGIAPA